MVPGGTNLSHTCSLHTVTVDHCARMMFMSRGEEVEGCLPVSPDADFRDRSTRENTFRCSQADCTQSLLGAEARSVGGKLGQKE